MTENIFRFYRGSCHLFYEDLHKAVNIPKSPPVWICGDLHLENFGSYKGSNGLVYFDLNDFDESILAPAAWEVVRTLTSIFISFDFLHIEQKKAARMAKLFLKRYSCFLSGGKAFYIERKIAKGIVRSFLTKASRRSKKQLLNKRTKKSKNTLAILTEDPRHFEIEKTLKRELCHHITEWILFNSDGPYNYEVIDAAFRLAGTGSVGLNRDVFLLKSTNAKHKYLLIDMKQSRQSSLLPYIKTPQPLWETEAERVVAIQQRMQNVPPMLLSHSVFKNESYLIQELQPVKDSLDFRLIKERYRDICQVIDDMAMLTASSQLRSTGRQGSANTDELIAFGENKKWQDDILNYASEYAKTVKQDFRNFRSDFKSGAFNNQKKKL